MTIIFSMCMDICSGVSFEIFFFNTATIFARSRVHAWAFCLGCTDICSVAACQLVARAIGNFYSVNMGLLLKY